MYIDAVNLKKIFQDSCMSHMLLSLSPLFKLVFHFLPQRQVKMMYLNRISELLMALKLYTSCIRFMCPNGRGA